VSTTSSTRPTERLRNTEKGPRYVDTTYLGPDTTVRLLQPRLVRHDYDTWTRQNASTILATTITMTRPKPPRRVQPPPKRQQQGTTVTRDAYATRATTTPSRSQTRAWPPLRVIYDATTPPSLARKCEVRWLLVFLYTRSRDSRRITTTALPLLNTIINISL
jgi:hypothetical protein